MTHHEMIEAEMSRDVTPLSRDVTHGLGGAL
jgi:hypothetical protein